MNFILENYLVIILLGLFFVFALIGYLIDTLRNNTKEEKEEIPNNIKPVEITDLNLKKNEGIKEILENANNNNNNNNTNDADELLKNYNQSIKE